jgi:hypothetical protein
LLIKTKETVFGLLFFFVLSAGSLCPLLAGKSLCSRSLFSLVGWFGKQTVKLGPAMSAKNNAADRQRMRELIEERKKKLADLQEKNKQAAVKTPGGAAATPEKSGLGGIGSPMTPSRPGSSMGTADVLAMVDTLVSPSVSTPSKILSTVRFASQLQILNSGPSQFFIAILND